MRVQTISRTGEPVTLEEARTALRMGECGSSDVEITRAIAEARDWAERFANRTFMRLVTRKMICEYWPRSPLKFDHPPLRGVTGVEYYDEDEALQTLDTSYYYVVTSTDGCGFVEWSYDTGMPVIYDRPDCVQITYTTGYAECPQSAKSAIKLKIQAIFDGDDGGLLTKAAERMLSNLGWGIYA